MNDQIEYELFTLPAAFMLQHKLSDQVVTTLNEYLDSLRQNKNRQSAADTLVGQIHQGEQLVMDFCRANKISVKTKKNHHGKTVVSSQLCS